MKKLSNLNIVLLVVGWPLIIFFPASHPALNLVCHIFYMLGTVCLFLDLFTKNE